MPGLGGFLKLIRKRRGLTQQTVAKKCNISSKAISRYETGRALPDFEILSKLVHLYNIDMNSLFEKTGIFKDMEMRSLTVEECNIILEMRKCGQKVKVVHRKVLDVINKYQEESEDES